MTFLESIRAYQRPGVPARHAVSKILIPGREHKRLITGKRWQEAAHQDSMKDLSKCLEAFANAHRMAAAVTDNPDLRPEVAKRRTAEKRLEILAPSLDALERTAAAVVDRAFGKVTALESEIMAVSAPVPPGTDIDRLRRTMLDIELRGELRRMMAEGKGPNDGKKAVLALLDEFKTRQDWDSFAAIENARPAIVLADFPKMRREWAIETFPELRQLLADRVSEAEYAVSFAGSAAGACRVATHQIVSAISGGEVDYARPREVTATWLKYGSRALRDEGRDAAILEEVDVTHWHPEAE